MKVTIDGMTFEGSEDEIERVVRKCKPQAVAGRLDAYEIPVVKDPYESVVVGLRPGRVV